MGRPQVLEKVVVVEKNHDIIAGVEVYVPIWPCGDPNASCHAKEELVAISQSGILVEQGDLA